MSKFKEDFIQNYNEDSNKEYIIEVDAEYRKSLHNLPNNLSFLPERRKIKKCHKLVYNLYDKNNYVAHIKTLKASIRSWINIK